MKELSHMITKLVRAGLFGTVYALTLGGCSSSPSELLLPEWLESARNQAVGLQLGILQFRSHPIVVSIPDSVVAGVAFSVQIRTYGGGNGCLAKKGYLELFRSEASVDMAPFDSVHVPQPGELCTLDLVFFLHEVDLSFPEAGDATVTVYGRKVPGDKPIAVTRTVRVVRRY
jgi:hypothetical protein